MEEEWGKRAGRACVQQAERTRHACINNPRGTSKRKREVDLPSGEPGCKQDAAAREDNARTRRGLARSLPSEIPGYSPVTLHGYYLASQALCNLESSLC